MIHTNILSLVGNTPLVALQRINPHKNVTIAVKIEELNPGGSVKDRVALAMVEAAEKSGELSKGKTIIEATSGNTGIGLAMVCAVKGYPLKLIMPESASEERKMIMRAYGAEIVLTPGHLSTDGAIEEAYRLSREESDKYILMDQFNNPASIAAHYESTAQEILNESEGKVTHVVATLGTSGTVMGIAKRMKESAPQVQVIAVEPYAGHKIQGLKNMQESYPPGIYDKKELDSIIHVEDDAAFAMCRTMAKEEGIFIGMSGGAAVSGALQVASELDEGLIVVILPDSGSRYLSTPLFRHKQAQGMSLFDIKSKENVPLDYQDNQKEPLVLYTFGPDSSSPDDPDFWRRMVNLDLLARYLRYKNQKASIVVGLADWDDQTLKIAREKGISREKQLEQFLETLKNIACQLDLQAKYEFVPSSSFNTEIVEATSKLLALGFGYEKLRSVYFDVERDKDYGILGQVDMEKLSLGKTVDFDNYVKDDPKDFTLLKRATLQDLKLDECLKTQWGNVRPSWYLQMASVLSGSTGSQVVVLGGPTHWFPHLENVRAIWAKFLKLSPLAWCVSGLFDHSSCQDGFQFQIPGGNVQLTRALLLSASYRKSLHLSADVNSMWEKNIKRIQECAAKLRDYPITKGSLSDEIKQKLFDLKKGFSEAMEDDLAIHRFWPVLFQFCRDMNKKISAEKISSDEAAACFNQLKTLDSVLGVIDWQSMPIPRDTWSKELIELVDARLTLRQEKKYEEADQLRQKIQDLGFVPEDTPDGTRIYPSTSKSCS